MVLAKDMEIYFTRKLTERIDIAYQLYCDEYKIPVEFISPSGIEIFKSPVIVKAINGYFLDWEMKYGSWKGTIVGEDAPYDERADSIDQYLRIIWPDSGHIPQTWETIFYQAIDREKTKDNLANVLMDKLSHSKEYARFEHGFWIEKISRIKFPEELALYVTEQNSLDDFAAKYAPELEDEEISKTLERWPED